MVSNNICLGGVTGISAIGSSNDTFAVNNCSSAGHGINATNLVDCLFDSNDLFDDETGIHLTGSRNQMLNLSTISSCDYGIMIETSANVMVNNNTIISCTAIAISTNGTSAPHDISWNQLSKNPIGISLGNATSPTVRNNTISVGARAIIIQNVVGGVTRDNTLSTCRRGYSLKAALISDWSRITCRIAPSQELSSQDAPHHLYGTTLWWAARPESGSEIARPTPK